ncbi:MAG: helicase [Deltaproteobacteria bacterium CG11_big_fil_rev_8_21_14_0_20_49_13]|nr:MAG: helicase [Deltaproteobacteria bacterium CG11_big_fil_rev_8_21_14_0_20_49_13]
MNTIILDLETKFTFDEVGGRDKFESLGISVAGVFDYLTGKYEAIEEKDIAKLEERLQSKPLVIGFNSKKFDMPVLKPYLHFDPSALPQLDIMEEIQNVVGHRIGLEAVAQATLGKGKSGSGLDAIRYFRDGAIDKLKKYCLDDVKVTKEVFEYGCKNKEVFFTSKFGGGRVCVPVNWQMENEEEKKDQLALF